MSRYVKGKAPKKKSVWCEEGRKEKRVDCLMMEMLSLCKRFSVLEIPRFFESGQKERVKTEVSIEIANDEMLVYETKRRVWVLLSMSSWLETP